MADLRAVGDQGALLPADCVAFDRAAGDRSDRATPGLLDALGDGNARARGRVWELASGPERLTIDLDAMLIWAHPERTGRRARKGGYGFAPLLSYGDHTGEALAGELRPGNAGASNAADPDRCRRAGCRADPRRAHRTIEILLRVDSAAPATT